MHLYQGYVKFALHRERNDRFSFKSGYPHPLKVSENCCRAFESDFATLDVSLFLMALGAVDSTRYASIQGMPRPLGKRREHLWTSCV